MKKQLFFLVMFLHMQLNLGAAQNCISTENGISFLDVNQKAQQIAIVASERYRQEVYSYYKGGWFGASLRDLGIDYSPCWGTDFSKRVLIKDDEVISCVSTMKGKSKKEITALIQNIERRFLIYPKTFQGCTFAIGNAFCSIIKDVESGLKKIFKHDIVASKKDIFKDEVFVSEQVNVLRQEAFKLLTNQMEDVFSYEVIGVDESKKVKNRIDEQLRFLFLAFRHKDSYLYQLGLKDGCLAINNDHLRDSLKSIIVFLNMHKDWFNDTDETIIAFAHGAILPTFSS